MSDLTPVDAAWETVVGRQRLLAAVTGRLAAQGAITELRHLEGLSASELDLLVRLESGWGNPQSSTSSAPLDDSGSVDATEEVA